MHRVSLSVLAVALSLITLTGCKATTDPAQARAKSAVGSIVDTRVEVVKAQNDLHETLFALKDLKNTTGDPKAAYAKFTKAFDSTQKQAQAARESAADMRANSAEYEKAWQAETAKLSDPGLKDSAEDRIAAFHDKYAKIRTTREECKDMYDGFVKDMEDVKTFLSNDLTPAGVQKAGPAIDKSLKDGDALATKIDDLVSQMNNLTASMTPTGKVPEKTNPLEKALR